jgi:hypothetical protein
LNRCVARTLTLNTDKTTDFSNPVYEPAEDRAGDATDASADDVAEESAEGGADKTRIENRELRIENRELRMVEQKKKDERGREAASPLFSSDFLKELSMTTIEPPEGAASLAAPKPTTNQNKPVVEKENGIASNIAFLPPESIELAAKAAERLFKLLGSPAKYASEPEQEQWRLELLQKCITEVIEGKAFPVIEEDELFRIIDWVFTGEDPFWLEVVTVKYAKHGNPLRSFCSNFEKIYERYVYTKHVEAKKMAKNAKKATFRTGTYNENRVVDFEKLKEMKENEDKIQ